MRLHYHKINELERKDRSNRGRIHYLRQFWHFYRGDEEKGSTDFHLETIVGKPSDVGWFAWRFHVGNAGSETPFDGHINILGLAAYWGTSAGRKLAQKITETKESKYSGRDLSLRVSEGHVWIDLWRDPDGQFYKVGRNGKKRKVYDHFSFSIDPREWIWGRLRYSYVDLQTYIGEIPFEEGSYPATLTLQEVFYGREKAKKRHYGYSVEVDANKGIPTHYDKSGGWKGDRTYGFGVKFPGDPDRKDWHIDAIQLVQAYVLGYRGRTGFRKPDPVEAG